VQAVVQRLFPPTVIGSQWPSVHCAADVHTSSKPLVGAPPDPLVLLETAPPIAALLDTVEPPVPAPPVVPLVTLFVVPPAPPMPLVPVPSHCPLALHA